MKDTHNNILLRRQINQAIIDKQVCSNACISDFYEAICSDSDIPFEGRVPCDVWKYTNIIELITGRSA